LTFTGSAATRLGALETYTSSLNNKTSSFATTGSNTFIGSQVVSGSMVQSGSFTTTGTIIAQTINVQTVTSSIVYSSGSNIFGNLLGDSQTFTGSVLVTGSLTIAGASSATSYSGTTACLSGAICASSGYITSSATATIRLKGNSTTGFDLQNDSGGSYVWNRDSTPLYFGTNDTLRFTIFSAGEATFTCQLAVCGNIAITSINSKFYQQVNNCKSADSVLDIYNTATNGFGASIQAGANNNNYALAVSNYLGTPVLYVAGNGQVGIGCGSPNAKLTINSQSTISSINIYGCNSSYISQVGWFDTTNLYASDGIGGNRVALIEIGTVAGTGTGCRGANMGLYTHEANGGLKLPLLLMHNGNVCLPQGNLYTTCTLFAPGTPIQVVTGTANVTSGAEGTGYSLISNAAGTTPAWNDGLQIASTSFTPKSSSSKILVMTNSVAMWERSNVSDHFYLWASNYTDGIVLVKSGQRLMNFGSGYHNGGIINLNGAFSSWGTSAKTISFRIGSTGGSSASFEWNPYYGASGFNADTIGNFTYTIMEIAQ
jgi:hypothetical protein